MSTLLSGLFCVITKGYSAWPLAENFSFWPGSTESVSSTFLSASRILSLSSVQAKKFATDYKAFTGHDVDSWYAAPAYDGMRIVAQAIEKAGSLDRRSEERRV